MRISKVPIQRALAWTGLALMLFCLVWLQLLPPRVRSSLGERQSATGTGSITGVVIDPGHGGDDSGAMRGAVLEKDLTLDVARRLERLARANGLATILTRAGDESVSLAGRAAAANHARDCVFVSIHFDEGSRSAASGVQTFYPLKQVRETPSAPSWLPSLQQVSAAPANLESQSLAAFVQDALVARTQAFNRGTRAEQFYVVANVRHPAVLVEGGFLSNNEDIAKLATEEYREQLATAISEGIMRYRDIANQQQPPPIVAEKSGAE
ncbi:MAG: N-acetylmuramoyl-L-alanine amidase [Chthoniobacterales bacterium]